VFRFDSTAEHRRGYALVLVMVGLVVLTILGVTAMATSQLDMRITSNMRQHKAMQLGASTGTAHARAMFEGQPNTWFTEIITGVEQEMVSNNDPCAWGWVSEESWAEEGSMVVRANDTELASYVVDVCYGICAAHEQLGGASTQAGGPTNPQGSLYAADVVSTGQLSTRPASARIGAMTAGTTTGACR
jgi:hypothetical protein